MLSITVLHVLEFGSSRLTFRDIIIGLNSSKASIQYLFSRIVKMFLAHNYETQDINVERDRYLCEISVIGIYSFDHTAC